jgi:hypothetical protein
MGTSRPDSNIIEVLNDLTPVAICVDGGKLYLLVHHYKYIDFRDAPRAVITKVKWPNGYAYISNPINKLNQIVWQR